MGLFIHRRMGVAVAACAYMIWGGSAHAQGRTRTLFNPTPRSEMREMSTDRPDMTESPLSVDPGHVQVEVDAVAWEHEVSDEGVTDTVRFGTSNVRIGLLPSVDFQVVVQPIVHRVGTVSNGQPTDSLTGVGDTTLRLKVNLVGNQGERFAIGLLPFVSLPTATSGLGATHTEFGVAVPFSYSLPAGFELAAMLQFDAVADPRGEYSFQSLGTVTVGHDIVGNLGGFVEVAGNADLSANPQPGFELHGGLTYAVNDDIQLDTGAFGTLLGPRSGSVTTFLGITLRR